MKNILGGIVFALVIVACASNNERFVGVTPSDAGLVAPVRDAAPDQIVPPPLDAGVDAAVDGGTNS